MKLWKITPLHPMRKQYDVYDAAIVAAVDELSAKTIHPHSASLLEGEDPNQLWDLRNWVSMPAMVEAEYIGRAAMGVDQGVILASFIAG